MLHLNVFSDASVNTKLKVGYGAYLVASDLNESIETLKGSIKIKRFEKTSSTKSELQTFLWALKDTLELAGREGVELTIYTDCQNIVSLPGRQSHLEKDNYFSAKNNRLNNYKLYQEFFRLTSQISCKFVKIKGHRKSTEKNLFDRIFNLVDKASRQALRQEF